MHLVIRKLLLVSFSLILFTLFIHLVNSQNIILDGSFEWDNETWYEVATTGAVAQQSNTSQNHSGSASAMTSTINPTADSTQAYIYQNIGGRSWKFTRMNFTNSLSWWTFWFMNASNGPKNCYTRIKSAGSNNLYYYYSLDGSTPTNNSNNKYLTITNPTYQEWTQYQRNLWYDWNQTAGFSDLDNITVVFTRCAGNYTNSSCSGTLACSAGNDDYTLCSSCGQCDSSGIVCQDSPTLNCAVLDQTQCAEISSVCTWGVPIPDQCGNGGTSGNTCPEVSDMSQCILLKNYGAGCADLGTCSNAGSCGSCGTESECTTGCGGSFGCGPWTNATSLGEIFYWDDLIVNATVDATPPIASFGTNPVDHYNDSDGFVEFEIKCSDDEEVSSIQLWANVTGIWNLYYLNLSYQNDTWVYPTLNGLDDGYYLWGISCNDSFGNLDASDTNRTFTVDSSPPSVIFISQYPTDLDSLNAINTGFNITYNITSSDLNLSTIRLFYKTNRTNSDYSRFINGTTISGFSEEENYSEKNGDSFKWVLDDNEIYPATYNIDPEYMENTSHTQYSLNGQNHYLKINLLNVSNSTYYSFFEIMAKNVTSATSLRIYYCNSSYSSGSIQTNRNCYNFGNILAGTDYNHCHSEHEGNYSCHHVLPFPINLTNGKIGNVSITSNSYFVLRGAQSGTWNVSHISQISRTDAIQTSTNSGNSWTNQAFTVDSHLHQYDGSDKFYYYACANDTNNNQNCSSLNLDLIDLGGLPPSSPSVYSPINSTYRGDIEINYTAAASPNGYDISYYNLTLVYPSNDSLISIISGNNSLNLGYIWDSSSQPTGQYEIKVQAFDNLSQSSYGLSEPFSLDYVAPQWSSKSEWYPSNYNSSQSLFNITWSDSNLQSVLIESNFSGTNENVSMNDLGAGKYGYSTLLGAGTYYWKSYANDSLGNLNISSSVVFTISKATVNLGLNSTPSWSVEYGTETNVSGTNCPGDIVCKLYLEGQEVSNNDIQTFGVGTYDYVYNSSGNDNYTSDTESNSLIVNKNNSIVYLSINGSRSNRNYYNGTVLNISCKMNFPSQGNVEIWTNYSSGVNRWHSGNSPIENISLLSELGTFWFKCNWSGNDNYTSDEETWNITLLDILPPEVQLNLPIDNYNSSDPAITFNCTAFDDLNLTNITLYGNWSNWHANETNSSPVNDSINLFSKTLSEGKYIWNCLACDNQSRCSFADSNRTLTIDSTGPIILLSTYGNNTKKKNSESLVLNISVSDSGVGVDKCTINIESSSTGNSTIAYSNGWCNGTYALSGSTNGNKTIRVYANDSLGNLNLNNSYFVWIDSTNPTASFGTNPANNYNSSTNLITFDFKCSDNTGVSTIELWTNTSGTWHANYSNSSYQNNTWLNISIDGISNGNYGWAVYCNDSHGNSDWSDTNRTFSVDSSEPVAFFGTNPIDDYVTNESTITFDFKCSDNTGVSTIELWTNTSGTWHANYSNSSYQNNTWLNISIDGISEGSHYIWTIYCNDTSGISKWVSVNRTFSVDTEKPTISLLDPASNREFDAGTTSVTFRFNVTDNYDENLSCSVYSKNSYNLVYCENESNCSKQINGFSAGSFNWSVNCSDGFNRNVSEIRNFSIKVGGRGGGGGGGGEPQKNITNQTVNGTIPEENYPGGFVLEEGQEIVIIIDNNGQEEEYTLGVESIQEKTVQFIIMPGDLIDKFEAGQIKQLDLNGDGKKDIELALVKILNGRAIFSIKYLAYEKALCGDKKCEYGENSTTCQEDCQKEEVEVFTPVYALWGFWLAVIIILGLVAYIIITRRNQMKKIRMRYFIDVD